MKPIVKALKWMFSIFRLREGPPPFRELPGILLRCTVWGLVSGPFFALFFTGLTSPHDLRELLTSPALLAISSLMGVVFSLCFYVFCGPGNATLAFWLRDVSAPKRIAAMLIYNAVACSLAFTTSALIIEHLPFTGIRIHIPYFWQMLVIDAAIGAIMAVLIGSFMKLKLQVERAQAEVVRKQLETARAQSLALQSQINPHFFFNTLNSISALIDDDPAAARSMIGRMADMFRYTLGCSHTESVPLTQELQFVRDYLDIEQARFRSRLRIELPAGPLPDMRVPGLVLQPLVENAVKHGIAQSIAGGTVSISVHRSGQTARIVVGNTSDAGSHFDSASLYRPGHALENVRARLRLFTGETDPLRISTADGWTEFSFESGITAE